MAGESARIKRLVLRLGAMAFTLGLVSLLIALHRFRAVAHRSTIVNILSSSAPHEEESAVAGVLRALREGSAFSCCSSS